MISEWHGVCEAEGCYDKATEWHHIFPKTKSNLKLYGSLIHDRRNLQELCYYHHHNAPVKHYSEREFCDMMDIQPRSKSGKL